MKIMARPDGPGSSPSGPTPTGSAGKAATIPRAAKRQPVDDIVRSYLAAFRMANNGECVARISYESGWIVFRNSSNWRTGRYRVRQLVEMTERLLERAAAQGMEARSAETLGSARKGDSPVGEADAPIPSPTPEP